MAEGCAAQSAWADEACPPYGNLNIIPLEKAKPARAEQRPLFWLPPQPF